MVEAEGVTQLVDSLFNRTLVEEYLIRRQSVELLAQAGQGDQGAPAVRVGQAKNEVELWNERIQVSHTQNPQGITGVELAEQDFRRILAAASVESGWRRRQAIAWATGLAENLRYTGT